MTTAKRVTALSVLAAAALSLGAAPALAAAHTRHVEPPVSVIECEEGGGYVATDIRERREFCLGGEFNDRYVVWL
ncbi:hypothetical protein ACFVXG_02035 [Kitasatospora sp. NPDC058162]|uniref:hypothetical protein n=1 Tax=Kitasatospora sp. NPDC058162 TaxID=3346362 RepID=UPI0036D9BA1B